MNACLQEIINGFHLDHEALKNSLLQTLAFYDEQLGSLFHAISNGDSATAVVMSTIGLFDDVEM